MRKLKWGIGFVAAVLISTVVVTGVARAQRFSTNVGKDTVVDSSLYSAGQTVKIRGEIKGDVFCAGRSVDIDATVRGDIICAGQDVTIAGTVDGDVRVAGQQVSISATIAGNATAAADVLSVDAPASIGQDLTAIGTTVSVKGSVSRDALLSGTSSIVNGSVGRDVTFEGAKLELKDKARIGGKLAYTSRQDVKQSDVATVAGGIEHKQPEQGNRFGFNLGWYLLVLAALTLAGLALVLVAPRTIRGLSDHIGSAWLKPMLVGFTASIGMPLVAVLLLVTIVGIPLGGLLLLVWLLLMMVSGPIVAYWLGRRLLRRQQHALLHMLAGSAVLVTLYFVPVLGFIIALAAYWTGSGAALLAIGHRLGKPNYIAK